MKLERKGAEILIFLIRVHGRTDERKDLALEVTHCFAKGHLTTADIEALSFSQRLITKCLVGL